MKALRGFADAIDAFTDCIGHSLAVLVWATAITCAAVVFLRYVMHVSFVWMQELYVWIHAVVFMIGAGYAMRRDAHVRVDIFYRNWSSRTRALVEIFGTVLFTLPWVIVLAWMSWPYIRVSWTIMEGASQAGGPRFHIPSEIDRPRLLPGRRIAGPRRHRTRHPHAVRRGAARPG